MPLTNQNGCAKVKQASYTGTGALNLRDMLGHFAQYYCELCRLLERLAGLYDGISETPQNLIRPGIARLPADLKGQFTEALIAMRKLILDLEIGSIPISRIQKMLDLAENTMTIELHTFRTLADEISWAMKSRLFYAIPENYNRYIDDPKSQWQQSATRWVDLVDDVESAGKCLAFGLPTSAVFHTMLIVDHGLGHLAKKHDVAYDFQDWHRVLEELMRRKETLPRSQEKDQLSNILHHLYIIKDAYRVPTMHARGIYTEDKARVIYDNAAAFMETLAVFV